MLDDLLARSYPDAPRELDDKHPGRDDAAYVRRRHELYELARSHRVGAMGWPQVTYTAAENGVWRHICAGLTEAHGRRACSLYRAGKQQLGIDPGAMPQLGELDRRLQAAHGFGLVPAEGLIDVRLFMGYLGHRMLPCTQFLRHQANPGFTPEPDAVHDVLGHVPSLMDRAYTDVVQRIGAGVLACHDDDLAAWSRLYWFTVEFGLLQEGDEVRVLGAGLLSSLEEIDFCFSDAVSRRPFVLDEVIRQDYDPSCMQLSLFVLPSLAQLAADVDRLQAAQRR